MHKIFEYCIFGRCTTTSIFSVSASVGSRDVLDKVFGVKSKYCVRNIITESNPDSKSGLRTKIHPKNRDFFGATPVLSLFEI
jgi:hypothetical protein